MEDEASHTRALLHSGCLRSQLWTRPRCVPICRGKGRKLTHSFFRGHRDPEGTAKTPEECSGLRVHQAVLQGAPMWGGVMWMIITSVR